MTKKSTPSKPKLHYIGPHLVDLTYIRSIRAVQNKDIYILDFKSDNNNDFPLWLEESEVEELKKYFTIVGKPKARKSKPPNAIMVDEEFYDDWEFEEQS